MHGAAMFNLTGKIALVSGGRGLYGSVICEGLAEAGAHVIIASRDMAACEDLAAELRKAGHSAEGFALELESDTSIDALAVHIQKNFGRLNILVNNAVTRAHYSGFEDIEREQMLKSLDINIAGTVMLTKRFIEGMKERKSGSIINIGSIHSVIGPHFPYYDQGQTSPLGYTIEKWGMVGFTKWLAAYYGSFGIRVNCISPGGYDPMLEVSRPGFYARYGENTPLGRWPDRDDIKGPVIFLASEASRYMTGVNMMVDGGFTIW